MPAIDGLPGVAILLVMAHHFVLYEGPIAEAVLLDKPVSRLTYAGWIGVDGLLVLSGFLITQSLVVGALSIVLALIGWRFWESRFLRLIHLAA